MARIGRRGFLGAGLAMLATPLLAQRAPRVEVWRDPNCGCCGGWIDHLRAEGFAAVVSGAGPSVLVLADGPGRRLDAARVAASVSDTPWEPLMLAVDVKGGTVRDHTEGSPV